MSAFMDDSFRVSITDPQTWPPSNIMSLNLIQNINDKASIKMRRKMLAWGDQYLKKAINGKS